MFNNKYIHKIKYNIKQNINHISDILFTYLCCSIYLLLNLIVYIKRNKV